MTVCDMPQPPTRVTFTPAERGGGIHQIRGWVCHGAGTGFVLKRQNM